MKENPEPTWILGGPKESRVANEKKQRRQTLGRGKEDTFSLGLYNKSSFWSLKRVPKNMTYVLLYELP